MRIIFTVFFVLLIGLPFVVKAQPAMMFADASSSIFRFQYKLAEQGNPEAQYKVGEMYELGRGVPMDKAKAREWYNKSVKQGHQKSSYRLLYMDIETSGMNAERKQQMAQLQREAKAGISDAQYFLGRMYAHGVGVSKDLKEAQTWYSKATFNGVPEAESELIAVEEEIARVEARQAQQKAAAEAERKKKEAEEQARKEEAKKARQRELAAKREAEKKREADMQQLQQDKAAAAAESKRRAAAEAARKRQEAAAAASKQAPPADAVQDAPEVDENAVFESDPCKGKKAKFLSICK